jgi:hypothetical protein
MVLQKYQYNLLQVWALIYYLLSITRHCHHHKVSHILVSWGEWVGRYGVSTIATNNYFSMWVIFGSF